MKLISADEGTDLERHMSLKAFADQAKMNLDRVEADIARHQGTHAP